ncbi:MAG: Holliday junction resolvase RuvX [Christensenellaceae bacterium]
MLEYNVKKWYNLYMGRIVAFDIGNKRVGVAVSDPLFGMALPKDVYYRKNFETDVKKLLEIAKSYEAELIVCGLPLNTDGTKSEQTLLTESFVDALRSKTDIRIVFQDERFTTIEARRVLINGDVSRNDRKKFVDSIAASYILDDYIRKNKN